jgi:hypothetical protein
MSTKKAIAIVGVAIAAAIGIHFLFYSHKEAQASQSWWGTTSLAAPLETQAATINNGYLYVIGGLSNGTPTDSVMYASLSSAGTIGNLQNTTPLPYTLYRDLCGVVNNNYLYAVGGIANNYTTSTVMYAQINSNGTLGVWKKTTPLPTPLQLQGEVAADGYLYVIGGSAQHTALAGEETSTVLYAKFSAVGTLGPFKTTESIPTPDYKTCPVAVGGTIYLLGGEVPLATSSVWYATPSLQGTIKAWNPTLKMLYTDAATAIVSLGNSIYIMGGDTTGVGGDTTTVSQASLFVGGGTGISSYSYLSPLPKLTSRNAGAGYAGGYIYSIGGLGGGTNGADTSTINALSI